MVSVNLINENIMITCSSYQVINVEKLKEIYRLCLNYVEQYGNIPVIVDIEKGVTLNDMARKIYKRLDARSVDLTMVIISM